MFERLSSEPIYNTRAVVQRTGVPADTFRAWERRYGIPNPIRTSGNQRLYAERDIATIKWLRDQTIAGMTISQAIALFHSQNSSRLKADPSTVHADSHTANGQHLGGGTGPYREIRDELVRSLLLLDGSAADRVVEEALAIINLEDVCLHVLQSALTDIGARWEHGKASVAVEHYASCYVQRKFGALFNQSNPNEGRGPIVAACPEGELHEIGLLLTCLFLSRRSYQILFLGANLPIDDLVLTIDRVQPPLVLLSASREETALKVAQYVRPLKAVVRDKAGRDLPEIGFGGHVFVQRPDLRLDIDGTYLGVDAREVTKNVDRIFALLSV
jgi:DNA-binding transcriptional MerR regulator